MSHRRQSFYYILSLQLLLSKRRRSPPLFTNGAALRTPSPREQVGCQPKVRFFSFFLFLEDINSVLKRSAKVGQQRFVKQMLGPFLTEFALNLTREGTTPIQGGFHGALLPHI